MAGSDVKVLFVKSFPGGAVICFTTMETQASAECRVTNERLPGRVQAQPDSANSLDVKEFAQRRLEREP
jgi:hypothetical protein